MTEQKEIIDLMREAYLAGFNASGEGYNGEYPFSDRGELPTDNEGWREDRDGSIAGILKDHAND